MTVIFSNLNSATGLKKLDEYLLTRSYITGYQASKYDLTVYAAVSKPLSSDYVNVSRWYNHIDALLRISGVSGEGSGVTIERSTPVYEAITAPPATDTKMDPASTALLSAYRAYKRDPADDLGVFLAHYRQLWAYANPCGAKHTEGIFRLIYMLPVGWREWALHQSGHHVYLDANSYLLQGDLPSFVAMLWTRFALYGAPPPGPYGDRPMYQKVDTPWDWFDHVPKHLAVTSHIPAQPPPPHIRGMMTNKVEKLM